MSNTHKAQFIGAGNENIQRKNGKRLSVNDNFPAKKLKQKGEVMTDTTTQKRANFSALNSNPNGMNKNSTSLLSTKPSSAKKLIIKNFKGISNTTFFLQKHIQCPAAILIKKNLPTIICIGSK